MLYGTRSRRHRLQPALPLPRRDSSHEGGPSRHGNDLTRGSSHNSSVSLLSESSLEHSEDESETLLTPTPTHSRDKLSLSKGQDQIDGGSMGIASPNLALQNAFKPMITQKAQGSQPGHARITHFDFTKYTPGTPGSESHPIKIEDSPDTSLSWLTRSQKTSVHQEPFALPVTRLDVPAIQHGYQASFANYIEKENPDGSSLTILPAGLEMSATGISIIASPKAATSFLHCFLAAEKHWLKSCDHDIDPDIKFWKIFVARFNANPLGYQIDAWLTARKIATTLCSQPYKMQVQQQTTSADDAILRLISAIEDCRRMSIRRRWGQQSGFENIKASSDDTTTEEDAQKGILGRIPKTIEDQEKLIQALQKRCAESGYSNNPEAETSTTGLRANYQSAQKGVYPNPYNPNHHGSSRRSKNTRLNVPSNFPHGLRAMGRNSNNIFRKRGNYRPRGGYPHPSATEGRGSWRGAPPRYRAQENDWLHQH